MNEASNPNPIAQRVVAGLLRPSSPMQRGYEEGRHVVAFHATGWLRILPGLFLLVWLGGWAVGEALVGSLLAAGLLRAIAPEVTLPFAAKMMPPEGLGGWLVMGFLTFWFAMWTLGGIAAFGALGELLFLRERLIFDAGGIRIERSAPFLRSREWKAPEIEGVFLDRRSGRLELEVRGRRGRPRRRRLITLGTPEERRALRDELRALFAHGASPREVSASVLPDGWESRLDESGAVVLGRSRAARGTQARVMAVVTLGLAAAAWAIAGAAGHRDPMVALPIAVGLSPLLLGTLWLAFGGTHLRIRSGTIEFRRWFLGKTWSEEFRPTSVRLTQSKDSDGDEHWAVEVHDGPRHRRVHSAMNELEPVRALGNWLAGQVGRELELPRGVDLTA